MLQKCMVVVSRATWQSTALICTDRAVVKNVLVSFCMTQVSSIKVSPESNQTLIVPVFGTASTRDAAVGTLRVTIVPSWRLLF